METAIDTKLTALEQRVTDALENNHIQRNTHNWRDYERAKWAVIGMYLSDGDYYRAMNIIVPEYLGV